MFLSGYLWIRSFQDPTGASCHTQPETVFPDWGVGEEETSFIIIILNVSLWGGKKGNLSHVFLALRRGEFKPHLRGLILGLKH